MNEDTQRLFEEHGVDKISFYFINSPLVNNAFTTCVLINSSQQRIEARGVSICSLLDTFSKSEGKNKAFGRAVKALARRENNWRINGSGRDDEFVKRGIKIKTREDELRFRETIAQELKRIDPDLLVSASKSGAYKKYSFEVPVSYPVKLANSLYKYKSHYRPIPVGEEKELLNRLTIFTEEIQQDNNLGDEIL